MNLFLCWCVLFVVQLVRTRLSWLSVHVCFVAGDGLPLNLPNPLTDTVVDGASAW